MRKNKNGRKKSPRKKGGNSMVSRTLPKPILMQPMFVRKVQVQIQTANATSDTLRATDISSLCCGVMAITATTSRYFSNQFKLRRVSLWAGVPAFGSPVAVSLKLADVPNATAGIGEDPQIVGDTSVNVDRPAFCSIVPKKGTFTSWYTSVTSTNLMIIIQAPIGAILQFDVQYTLDDVGPTSAGPTLIAATPGTIYHKIVTGSGGATYNGVPPLNVI